MDETEQILERTWEYIRDVVPNAPSKQINYASVNRNTTDERYSEAIWQFATAGILRPDGMTFTLTPSGEEIIKDDNSPYRTTAYFKEVKNSAPHLDSDSEAYLGLALQCVFNIAPAAVALTRVATEVEIDSIINVAIASWNPKATVLKKLRSRDLSTRVEEFNSQLKSRNIQTREENELFKSYITQIRLEGNNVMHPKGGMTTADPMLIQSLFHDFRRFASMASDVKATLT